MTKAIYIIIPVTLGIMLTSCRNNRNNQQPANEVETTIPTSQQTTLGNVEVRDFDRAPVRLADEVAHHKLTIIDFWASWCSPCMREMPNLVDIYSSYKEKGLGIIGISLDTDYNRWKDIVENQNMHWLQLSDLRGWDGEASNAFGVQSIPYTLLVDHNGKIINQGIRGDKLRRFVEEYFEKSRI